MGAQRCSSFDVVVAAPFVAVHRSSKEVGSQAQPRSTSHRVRSGPGRTRWGVERGFAWLHAYKRLRTRYGRRADIHLGLHRLACALICYRQLVVLLR